MVFQKKVEERKLTIHEIEQAAFERGLAQGREGVTLAVVQALGFSVQPASSPLSDQVASPEPAPPPPASEQRSPPSAQGPVCVRCGHGRDAHVPLSEKSCFAPGCAGCKGFTLKKGVFG